MAPTEEVRLLAKCAQALIRWIVSGEGRRCNARSISWILTLVLGASFLRLGRTKNTSGGRRPNRIRDFGELQRSWVNKVPPCTLFFAECRVRSTSLSVDRRWFYMAWFSCFGCNH